MSTHLAGWESPPDYTTEAGDIPPSRNLVNSLFRTVSASEPRYVYYHAYTPDGVLRCKNPLKDNPFIGRLKATSVPPPHTVASLKRAIVQAEGLPDPAGDLTSLFETRNARNSMVSTARVDILTGDLGATVKTPIALVLIANPTPLLPVASEDEVGDHLGNQLPPLYYRLYNRGGEEKSVRRFDANEPGLGNVKREPICPPRNALSVKHRIGEVEGKPIYQYADLFKDLQADRPLSSAGFVPDAAGSTQEHPILLVQPERRPGLYNRPVQIVALPPQPYIRQTLSNRLSLSVGDILQTDGITQYKPGEGNMYTAVDKNGRKGWISADSQYSKLLDEPSSSGCSIQ
ncbi:hypothetical protein B0H14DRAFT_3529837 [Mycena olivaceomarginata]|nr:hypothetical protein B0H14DRAFT_3529837 [Mycena olivaceomarginata]